MIGMTMVLEDSALDSDWKILFGDSKEESLI